MSGYVYSEHSKPVPNVKVSIGEENTFKDETKKTEKATTDNEGFYSYSAPKETAIILQLVYVIAANNLRLILKRLN